jgi:hypothetical protein
VIAFRVCERSPVNGADRVRVGGALAPDHHGQAGQSSSPVSSTEFPAGSRT